MEHDLRDTLDANYSTFTSKAGIFFQHSAANLAAGHFVGSSSAKLSALS
jgi:hypothetical protein